MDKDRMDKYIELSETEIKLGFVAVSIETIARRLGCSYRNVVRAFKQSNIIDKFLLPNYEALHTQSREYVDDAILEYLTVRNIKI